MQEIQYYADEEGRKPVQEFIDALDCKMQAKVFGRLELLEEYGPMLGMPLKASGRWHFRTQNRTRQQHNAHSVFLCCWEDDCSDERIHQENAKDPSEGNRKDKAHETGLEEKE